MNENNKNQTGDGPLKILLAEDNESDILITQRAFKEVSVKNDLYVVRDGEEALDFMYHRGRYTDKEKYPTPHLILLDIKMPKMDGFKVLETLKEDLEYMAIPVIMLTTSKNEDDIARSYRKHAASYIQKPIKYEEFLKFVDAFCSYWQTVVKSPKKQDK